MDNIKLSGFTSAAFCAELSDAISHEAISQYGVTTEAVHAYRVKSAQLNYFFDDTTTQKRWANERQATAERMQRAVFLLVGQQGRLRL